MLTTVHENVRDVPENAFQALNLIGPGLIGYIRTASGSNGAMCYRTLGSGSSPL